MCDSGKCCILQLATRDHAFIIDTIHLAPSVWGSLLQKLFSNDNGEVVGFGLKQDLAILRSYPEAAVPQAPKTLQDLETLAIRKPKARRSGESTEKSVKSLSDLCELHLGKPMDKTFRVSAWERRPLRLPQLVYAALDAVVCVHLREKINAESK